jgi:glucose-1-phosphate thymidylyltransferase
MIYGLIPVGGYGTRLGLPFAKELIPLKGFDKYYPVSRLTVDNMLTAGCEKIFFIHGQEYKLEIKNLFKEEIFFHIKNLGQRQSEVFSSFYNSIAPKKDDIYLYGLPDTYYKHNLFFELLKLDGLGCGMYKVSDTAKVGRLNFETGKFVKSIKKEKLSEHCWGVLKLDYDSLKTFNNFINKEKAFEAEELINQNSFKVVYGDDYYDLGTWDSLNKYWNS